MRQHQYLIMSIKKFEPKIIKKRQLKNMPRDQSLLLANRTFDSFHLLKSTFLAFWIDNLAILIHESCESSRKLKRFTEREKEPIKLGTTRYGIQFSAPENHWNLQKRQDTNYGTRFSRSKVKYYTKITGSLLRVNLQAETNCFKMLHLIRSWRLKDGESNFSNSTKLERH